MNALRPSQPDRPFHGLWSLWEIMFDLNVSAFFFSAMHLQHNLSAMQEKSGEIESNQLAALHEQLRDLEQNLDLLNAKFTKMEVARVKDGMSEGTTYEYMTARYNDICSRLSDELSTFNVVFIDGKMAGYYKPTEPLFGKTFGKQFQTASSELDEAAKCLALGRSTASVFHLMRLVEHGLRATAYCLGASAIQGGDRSWGKILGDLNAKCADKTTVGTWSGSDKAFFAEVMASLDAVRVAWRNATMHVENTYNDDQAEHIFVTVKGFMTKLASRCDENGDPKA